MAALFAPFHARLSSALSRISSFVDHAGSIPALPRIVVVIVVVVVMDLMAQVQSHLLSQQYEGMMKKANLRGIGGGMR